VPGFAVIAGGHVDDTADGAAVTMSFPRAVAWAEL